MLIFLNLFKAECVHALKGLAAARESLRRDRPSRLASSAFHTRTGGSASTFRTRCCHSSLKLSNYIIPGANVSWCAFDLAEDKMRASSTLTSVGEKSLTESAAPSLATTVRCSHCVCVEISNCARDCIVCAPTPPHMVCASVLLTSSGNVMPVSR